MNGALNDAEKLEKIRLILDDNEATIEDFITDFVFGVGRLYHHLTGKKMPQECYYDLDKGIRRELPSIFRSDDE